MLAYGHLSAAIIMALGRVLPKGCRVATSDVRARIESSDLTTFADASVICGDGRTANASRALFFHAEPSATSASLSRAARAADATRTSRLRHRGHVVVGSLRFETFPFVGHAACAASAVWAEPPSVWRDSHRSGWPALCSVTDSAKVAGNG